jgi:c-di-AMP phosphodiesterase-like protein
MKTLRKMNRAIKFFGLTSGQFGLFIVSTALIIIISIFKSVHPLFIVLAIAFVFFIASLLFRKLKIEHKKGNPDYLTGLTVKGATPKIITDRKRIFKHILKL